MQLKGIEKIVPVTIERDAEFRTVGLIPYSTENMLVFLENKRFLREFLNNENISCVITHRDLIKYLPDDLGVAISENPRVAFYKFHNYLALNNNFYWKDFSTVISPRACIHPTAYIAPKNVRIGDGTLIEPNVTILEKSIVGDNAVLRAGCIIGSEGFEFKRVGKDVLSISHAGGVKLHDKVELQANTCVNRGIFGGLTEIGEETKVADLVHISHEVKIGKRCFLSHNAMVGGSVTLGNDIWVGPGANISSGIKIGDGASVSIGSVVTQDVAAGMKVTGNFAISHHKFIDFIKSIR